MERPGQAVEAVDWAGELLAREKDFLAFWAARRGASGLPPRAALPPEALGPWIGWINLLVPLEGGRDFRYAVHATRSRRTAMPEMTGKRVSEWADARTEIASAFYRAAWRHRAPIYARLAEQPDRPWTRMSRVCVPLGDEDGVTHLMSLMSEHTPRDPTAFEIAVIDLDAALAGRDGWR